MAEANSTPATPKSPATETVMDRITQALSEACSAIVDVLEPAEDTQALFNAAVAGRAPADDDKKILKNISGTARDAIDTAQDTLNQALAGDEASFSAGAAADFATLGAAIAQFEGAVTTYLSGAKKADAVLNSAIAKAQSAFDRAATQTDAASRQWYLYYQMQVEIATALQAAQTGKAGDVATVLTAFGTLLSACGTYWGGVADLKATQELNDATAYETYWKTVEDTLDPN